jgi:hypothetical protein
VSPQDVLRVDVRPRWAFALPLRNGLDGLTRIRRGVLERLLHAGEEPVLVRVAQPTPDRVLFAAQADNRDAAEWASNGCGSPWASIRISGRSTSASGTTR